MTCPYCNNPAEWVDNATVYGRRYGKSHMMWICRPCDARVGCHNNTKNPLGTMANAALRKVRMATHAVLDPLWKEKGLRRGEVYQALQRHFGHEIHIGESDETKCGLIIEALKTIYPDLCTKP